MKKAKATPGTLTVLAPDKTPVVPSAETKGKVAKAIIPKPTRAEIIEALVMKRERQFNEEREKIATETDRLWKIAEAAVLQEIKDKPKLAQKGELGSASYKPYLHVTMSFKIEMAELGGAKKPVKAWLDYAEKNSARSYRSFNRDECRAEMRQALICDPARVRALADSQEIADTLKHIQANQVKPVLTIKG